MEKVSVITPCYNDGAYIMESIASVKAQTYPNIEIIVIDDGSDDNNTIHILEALPDEIHLIRSEDRLRPAAARNLGIQKATGKYILPLDADDLIDKTYLEKAVRIIEEDDQIGAVYCEADKFGEEKGRWLLPDYSFEKMLLDNIVFVTALFRKSDWEAIGGFNTKMEAGMEDYDFWLSILELDKEIYQIPEVLFHYRVKPKSRTTSFESDVPSMQLTYRDIYKNHTRLYQKHQLLYDNILRDALIEQKAIRKKYERIMHKCISYYRTPLIGPVLKKILQISESNL